MRISIKILTCTCKLRHLSVSNTKTMFENIYLPFWKAFLFKCQKVRVITDFSAKQGK